MKRKKFHIIYLGSIASKLAICKEVTMVVIFLSLILYTCQKFKDEILMKKRNLAVLCGIVMISVFLVSYRMLHPYTITISAYLEKVMN